MANKQTQRELAVVYRINQSTLSNLKKSGVDIYSRDEVRAAMLKQSKRPPAWTSGCPWDDKPETKPPASGDLPSLDMENLKRMTKEAILEEDWGKVKLIETVTKITKNLQTQAVLEGDYILKTPVQSDHRRIAAGVSSGLDSLCHELPAVCEGLTAAQMKGKVKLKTDSIKRLLADETSELYQINQW